MATSNKKSFQNNIIGQINKNKGLAALINNDTPEEVVQPVKPPVKEEEPLRQAVNEPKKERKPEVKVVKAPKEEIENDFIIRMTFGIKNSINEKLKNLVHLKKTQGLYDITLQDVVDEIINLGFKTYPNVPERPESVKRKEKERSNTIRSGKKKLTSRSEVD